ncbi:MAG: iron-containing alcohol dehydrogenase [Verrucomicrobia bacterium]|nr:iron-containing alcohol dehydrogenase [Verrucomicrobiota bacterium]
MHFEIAIPTRILFGPGTIREAAPLMRGLGRRALVVCGRDASRLGPLSAIMEEAKVEAVRFGVTGEPTIALVQRAIAEAKTSRCDMVVGYGGGSVIDAAKAVAGLLTNSGDLLDYLEIVGRAQPLLKPPAPWMAIPTTAGTGAEVTRNAVLASPEHGVKASLRSPLLPARLAVVDPELTRTLPPSLTAATGLDALTQLIEAYVCRRANPFADALCREAIPRVARSLKAAFDDGQNAAAREDMALASLFSGFALAHAGLGAVHGFAAPIGGSFEAPHGAVCAALLAVVMDVNVRGLRQRQPDNPALERYAEVARLLTGNAGASSAEGIAWVRDLGAAMSIPPLRAYGVSAAHMSRLCELASGASSMKANPLPLEADDLCEILERAL